MKLKEEWNPMPWHLHACKWNLLNNIPTDYESYCLSSEQYIYLPHTYRRHNAFSFLRKLFLKMKQTVSNESAFGFMILTVVCFTFYFHVSLLDNPRDFRAQTVTRIAYAAKSRVVVAIFMHYPSKFLKNTLKSLNESTHQADVWIFSNFVGDHVNEEAAHWYPTATVIASNERLNSTDTVQQAMNRFIYSNYEVLVIINSYTVLSFDWWNTLKNGLMQSRGVFSLFGTNRDHLSAEVCSELLCTQTWFGRVGSVWRRNLASRMLAETSNLRGRFEHKVEYWCKLKNIPLLAVRNSVIAVIDSDKMSYELTRLKLSSQLVPRQTLIDAMADETKLERHFKSKNASVQTRTEANLGQSSNMADTSSGCVAAVLRVHIRREDRAYITAYEAEQWIRYMQYAGVDTVYFYDAYEQEDEKLDLWVKHLFSSEVKYHDWFLNGTFGDHESERMAYQHAVFYYKDECDWHIQININEYPFMPFDIEKGFLKRFVHKMQVLRPDLSEIVLPVCPFVGQSIQASWLIERMQRRLPKCSYGLGRPLYFAKFVKTSGKYQNKMYRGTSEDINPAIVRINQYVGSSLHNRASNIARYLSRTTNDSSILPILEHLKQITLISNKMPLYATNQFWDSKY